jgi:Ca2+-binding EF-hand superfamily protein
MGWSWVLYVFHVTVLRCALQSSHAESGIPGHLKPLGFHRAPLGPVDEFDYVISPKEFWEKYASKGEPVVFRGAANRSLGFTRWTNDYLVENYGDLQLKLESKKEKGGGLPVGDAGMARDRLRHFISRYQEDDVYVVSQLPEPMYHEVSALPCLMCGSFKKRLLEVNYWMSSGGTKSILHRDADNAINCLFAGRKDWILIDRQYTHLVPLATETDGQFGAFALLDIERVNLKKYPDFAKVPWRYANLTAGDCLFLPYSYLHQVKSYERNIAVSLLFARLTEFEEDEDCAAEKLDFTPLSDLNIAWSYPGYGEMSMGNIDPEHIRHALQLGVGEDDRLTPEGLTKVLVDLKELSQTEANEFVAHMFKVLDPDDHGFLTKSDIDNFSQEALKEAGRVLDTDDANTAEYEEWLFDVGQVQTFVTDLASEADVDLDDFVMKWTSHLGGSMPIGHKLFHDLDVNEDGILTLADLLEAGDKPFKPFLKIKMEDVGNKEYQEELLEVETMSFGGTTEHEHDEF